MPNTALELVRDSRIETKQTVYNKTVQTLAHAEDPFLIGRTTGVLKKSITNLSKAVKEMGLTINMQKTKYMEVTKIQSNSRMLKVDDRNLKG